MLRRMFARIGVLEAAPPWGLGAGIAALVAAFAALVLGSTLVLTVYCGSPANAAFCSAANFITPPSVSLLGWTIGAGVTAAFVLFTRRAPKQRAALRLGGFEQPVFWVLLVSIGLAVTLDLLIIQFTTQAVEPELLGLRAWLADTLGWILAFVFMVVAQPAAEEIVFRGVLLPALRQAVGAWPGYVASAALYAVFHLLAYAPAGATADSLGFGLVMPFFGGLIFGAVRLTTGSTRAAILSHAAFGLFAVLKVAALG